MTQHHLEFHNDDLRIHRHRQARRRVHRDCRSAPVRLPKLTATIMGCPLSAAPFHDQEHHPDRPVQPQQGKFHLAAPNFHLIASDRITIIIKQIKHKQYLSKLSNQGRFLRSVRSGQLSPETT